MLKDLEELQSFWWNMHLLKFPAQYCYSNLSVTAVQTHGITKYPGGYNFSLKYLPQVYMGKWWEDEQWEKEQEKSAVTQTLAEETCEITQYTYFVFSHLSTQMMLTSKNNLKDDRPQSLKEQMILRTHSWGGVLLWWRKALPTQHSDLTPSPNRPDAAAHTTTFSCQKQAFPKLKRLLVSQLPNFKKGQHITSATKMSKLSENWSWWFWLWNKDELFNGCCHKRQ